MSGIKPIDPDRRMRLAPLFAGHRPSFLIDAVLEGHLGTAWADDADAPAVAQLAYADVVVLGGDPRHPLAYNLVRNVPIDTGIWPAPEGWERLLYQVHGPRLIALERYTFSDERLDLAHLRRLALRVPEGFHVRRIGVELARRIVSDTSQITADHVCNFPSPEDFVRRGIGFCALKDERVVSGASSYAICNRGIEVQVNTHPDFRGQGLATALSAKLLAHCLERGLEAHWDAANPVSARLATKLGYLPAGTYKMLVRVE